MANEVAHFRDNKVTTLTCAIDTSCPSITKSPSGEMESSDEVKTSNMRAYDVGDVLPVGGISDCSVKPTVEELEKQELS